MGILDKFLNKKRTRRNQWNNAPYHTQQPIYQNYPFYQNYPYNRPNADFRQANWEDQSYYNYRNNTQSPSEFDFQNNITVQTREPVAQPFYGNPLAVDSNFYNGPYNGQTQNSLYPNGNQQYGNQQYGNPYQSYQPGWPEQGYYPNGASPQQGIQPNPFQANPFIQQPFQQNVVQNKQSSGFGNVLNQFKSQNGSVDINKMMSTAGQMVSAVNQFSGIIKGIGGIFKA